MNAPDRRPPVWLLDVDEVVNASRAGWGGPPRSATVHVDGQGWRVRWSPQLIGRIRRLLDAELVEVRWCTSWCTWVDLLEETLGLPPLPRAWNGRPGNVRNAKYSAAMAVRFKEGRRLVWTDDELATLAPGEAVRDGEVLLVRPKRGLGLRPEHMDVIDSFVGATPQG